MVCLDSDLLIGFLRGKAEAARKFDELASRGEPFSTTPVNVTELFMGCRLSTVPEDTERVRELISRLRLLEYDHEAAKEAGNIRAALHKQDRPIGALDSLIVGIVKSHGETLVTRNQRHYARIPDLRLEAW